MNRIIKPGDASNVVQFPGDKKAKALKDSTALAFEMVKFSVIELRYSQVKKEFAATGAPEGDLLKALRIGHRVVIEDTLRTDPLIYFIISTQQMEMFLNEGEPQPSVLQILGTSQVCSLCRANAVERYRKLMQEEPFA